MDQVILTGMVCRHRLTFSRAPEENNFPIALVTENLRRMMNSTGDYKTKESANRIPEFTAPFPFYSVFSTHSWPEKKTNLCDAFMF